MPGSGQAPGAFSTEPPRDRPSSPPESYGVPPTGGDFVPWDAVVHRLLTATAYWLATVSADASADATADSSADAPTGVRPHVVPVWGVLLDGDLYLETGAPETMKSRNLERNDNVVVHLDNVDDVVLVRGRAVATTPDASLGRALADAYRTKYASYEPAPDSWNAGGLVRIEPERVLAWRDMPTATRWRFGPLNGGEERSS
jgi:hypothetical protein